MHSTTLSCWAIALVLTSLHSPVVAFRPLPRLLDLGFEDKAVKERESFASRDAVSNKAKFIAKQRYAVKERLVKKFVNRDLVCYEDDVLLSFQEFLDDTYPWCSSYLGIPRITSNAFTTVKPTAFELSTSIITLHETTTVASGTVTLTTIIPASQESSASPAPIIRARGPGITPAPQILAAVDNSQANNQIILAVLSVCSCLFIEPSVYVQLGTVTSTRTIQGIDYNQVTDLQTVSDGLATVTATVTSTAIHSSSGLSTSSSSITSPSSSNLSSASTSSSTFSPSTIDSSTPPPYASSSNTTASYPTYISSSSSNFTSAYPTSPSPGSSTIIIPESTSSTSVIISPSPIMTASSIVPTFSANSSSSVVIPPSNTTIPSALTGILSSASTMPPINATSSSTNPMIVSTTAASSAVSASSGNMTSPSTLDVTTSPTILSTNSVSSGVMSPSINTTSPSVSGFSTSSISNMTSPSVQPTSGTINPTSASGIPTGPTNTTSSGLPANTTGPVPFDVCPVANGTNYVSQGQTYLIECYVNYPGYTNEGLIEPSLYACIDACALTNVGFSQDRCYAASYQPSMTGPDCFFKTRASSLVPTTDYMTISALLLNTTVNGSVPLNQTSSTASLGPTALPSINSTSLPSITPSNSMNTTSMSMPTSEMPLPTNFTIPTATEPRTIPTSLPPNATSCDSCTSVVYQTSNETQTNTITYTSIVYQTLNSPIGFHRRGN